MHTYKKLSQIWYSNFTEWWCCGDGYICIHTCMHTKNWVRLIFKLYLVILYIYIYIYNMHTCIHTKNWVRFDIQTYLVMVLWWFCGFITLCKRHFCAPRLCLAWTCMNGSVSLINTHARAFSTAFCDCLSTESHEKFS
jgi:hypothetical protein